MIGRWGRAACFAIVMSACSLGFDGQEYQGESGGGPSAPCPAGSLSAPAVPDGWQGPVQMATALEEAALPSCPFVSSLVHVGPSSASDCTCECGMDAKSNCTAGANLYPEGSGCDGIGQPLSLPADRCHGFNTFSFTSGQVTWEPSGDPCVASADAPTPPPVEWTAHTLLCAASAELLADGSVCATPLAGFDSVICIYAVGMASGIYAAEATGTCAASGGEVTGEATRTEPLVVCCTS